MPTYEYQCDNCGHPLEVFQKINDDPLRVCPECGKRKLRRLISSGGGIVFKGSGFYATDYRKTPPPADSSGGSTSRTGDLKSADDSSGKSTSDDSGSGGSASSGSSGSDAKPKKTSSDD